MQKVIDDANIGYYFIISKILAYKNDFLHKNP